MRGSPCMCIRITGAVQRRRRLQRARRPQRDHVVPDRCARLDRRARDRRLHRVDGDRRFGRVAQRARSPARRARSPRLRSTGAAPGRVDSPPTSMMSAPASSMASACAQRPRLPTCPPSEKESGVTLSTPITYGPPSSLAGFTRLARPTTDSRPDRGTTRPSSHPARSTRRPSQQAGTSSARTRRPSQRARVLHRRYP